MATATAILDGLRSQLDTTEYKKLHWEGSFSDYLNIVLETPGVTRTAYQRLYDMILSHGTEDVYENKDKITRFKFFTEFAARHGDGIYGLDRPLMQLVNTFKSAALGYGTERRVILLHGPVGSAKTTIARLLKRGLEEYSRTDAGHALQLLLEGRRRHAGPRTRCTASRCNSCPRSTAPRSSAQLNEQLQEAVRLRHPDQGRPEPVQPLRVQDPPARSTTATG